MRKVLVAACLALLGSSWVLGQKHTMIALAHNDFAVNEIDMDTGKIVQTFKAVNQAHEAAVSPDGKTIYASVPQAGLVVILGAATFEEKGKIETPLFHGRTPQPPGNQRGGGAAGARGGQRGGEGGGGEGQRGAAEPAGVTAPDQGPSSCHIFPRCGKCSVSDDA